MSSVSVGRVLRRGVCAGAVGALAVAGLGSGAAVADDVPQTDALAIQSPYDVEATVAPDGGAAQYRPLALGLTHSNDAFALTDGRLTVDASGLAGIAEVAWPDNCTPDDSGTVAVCDTGDVPIRYSAQVGLRVRAVAGASVGAQGTITYSAEATGGPDGTLVARRGNDTTVTVGSGVDLGISAPQDANGVEPGTSLTVPYAITNTGSETAHGFSLSMWATYGLDVTTRYPQCAYTGPDADGSGTTAVTCSFDTDVAPGATVELPEPLRLAVTDHALYERFDYDVEPLGDTTDLDSSDNGRSWHIDADNTADFAVYGTSASGAAGDTVTSGFRFVNHGPAWAGDVSAGDPITTIDFYAPEGTVATSMPETCHGAHTPGDDSTIAHYACTLPTWAKPDLDVSFPFQLRIDRVVPDATGHVTTRAYDGTPLAFDANTGNNTAEVIVNPSA
ncbi:hypothetical protein [Streptomyces sp. N50]|uniref:hypothetical protein n=1 Tax=Streptomyces sp. N50 TaxID=3081765 RepID=UPI0029622834|nr:hypothetical protein [Streptomyces sp. N50]WOX07569.1 hypothetical protein R2B38_01270 [Streptomyces sp. N50]